MFVPAHRHCQNKDSKGNKKEISTRLSFKLTKWMNYCQIPFKRNSYQGVYGAIKSKTVENHKDIVEQTRFKTVKYFDRTHINYDNDVKDSE